MITEYADAIVEHCVEHSVGCLVLDIMSFVQRSLRFGLDAAIYNRCAATYQPLRWLVSGCQ
jgi:hypothetical protein